MGRRVYKGSSVCAWGEGVYMEGVEYAWTKGGCVHMEGSSVHTWGMGGCVDREEFECTEGCIWKGSSVCAWREGL